MLGRKARDEVPFGQLFLVAYSGILTIAFGTLLLCGFSGNKSADFDEITAKRINIVEPDGTLRLVISDKARFPGSPVKGKEIPRKDRDFSGMLFMDDEGTEMGGFNWGGSKKNGKAGNYGHFSFDRYNGNELFTLYTNDSGDSHSVGMEMVDSWSDEKVMQRGVSEGGFEWIKKLPPDALADWKKAHPYTRRGGLYRTEDKSVGLILRDQDGRDRLRVKVAADGSPSIEMLDETGKVIDRLPRIKS